MVVVGRDADARERSDCMGYARFCKELEDEDCDVHLWFAPFCAQVWQRSDDSDRRLVNLQHALITLIEELDPDGIRFPEHRARVQQAR